MSTTVIDRPRAAQRGAANGAHTIQWNESAAVAAKRLRDGVVASLTVVANGRSIGLIRVQDVERCERNGNWLDAVMVLHLLHTPRDTCN